MTEWTGVAGKRVVITGATNGIGLAAAHQLAALGAELTIVARSEARAAAAVASIRESGGERDRASESQVAIADLLSQAEVRRLAAELLDRYERIDVLVNNAGAIFASRRLTVDGIEATWALNHLAPFLLTNLLLERLKQHPPARIVTTASDAHRGSRIPFDNMGADGRWKGRGFARYGETKLANILFTAELGRWLEGSGVTATCYHPGLVATGFNRTNGRLMNLAMAAIKPFARPPEKGAETLVWLAASPEVSGENGGYFVDKRRILPSPEGQDMATAKLLWEVSRQQTQR
ncbi:MAG TPA: SDR family NAD(P)-dependent oxidoreductase [Actinomycetota bacterium]|nr:SDR family NAD(P)-dependent oxidoreductase [Actinomycetota bacterium]